MFQLELELGLSKLSRICSMSPGADRLSSSFRPMMAVIEWVA